MRAPLYIAAAGRDKHGHQRAKYQCDCGRLFFALKSSVQSSRTKSCGCLQPMVTAKRSWRHGHASPPTKTYIVWQNMHIRCRDPNCQRYSRYGGRGIKVCKRWHSFANFLADMGEIPDSSYSIERKDVNGNYEPKNCIWMLRSLQGRNTIRTIRVTMDGVTKSLIEWCGRRGISYSRTSHRINRLGWSPIKALTEPKKVNGSTYATK